MPEHARPAKAPPQADPDSELEPADLVVLGDDPFAATADPATATVEATMLGGRVVFDDGRVFA